MKQTISLNDNYGKRLRDEINTNGINNGLKGEVQIIVKNKDTGEIESQQKHNLIVYGAREWLLKKCFCSNTVTDNADKDLLNNSEILWFGVGNGGSEPGNPLQCGCTYGSDTDLYNPVRLRYEFDLGGTSSNPYYASRIMPNGDCVNGYYKKITYVGIKEDQANPYTKNGVVYYPNLIAEVRLEISSDDCCGQTYLNNDSEKAYADINEAALFIADRNLSDPGKSGKVSYTHQDYTYYDPNNNRIYRSEDQSLPEYTTDSTHNTYIWTDTKPFIDNKIQYFDIYNSDKTEKLNKEPLLFGVWTDSTESEDTNKCTGSINWNLSNRTITYTFKNKRYGEDFETTKTYVFDESITSLPETLDGFTIVTHGTIVLNVQKTDKFDEDRLKDKEIDCYCKYRNSYTTDFTSLSKIENLFIDTKNTYKYMFPVGYVFNENDELIVDNNFNKLSVIRFVQSVDVYQDIEIYEVQKDNNSTEVRFYCEDTYIDKISEGMKVYFTHLDDEHKNYPTEDNPATITEIFDARLNTDAKGTTLKSYFIIDNLSIDKSEVITLSGKAYKNRTDNPYTMFNRCCFSTIRVSKSREVLLIWRVYF